MKFDYKELRYRMKQHKQTQLSLSKAIGITSAALNYKLTNKNYFTQKDIIQIAEILKIKEYKRYFFRKEEE